MADSDTDATKMKKAFNHKERIEHKESGKAQADFQSPFGEIRFHVSMMVAVSLCALCVLCGQFSPSFQLHRYGLDAVSV